MDGRQLRYMHAYTQVIAFRSFVDRNTAYRRHMHWLSTECRPPIDTRIEAPFYGAGTGGYMHIQYKGIYFYIERLDLSC